MNFQKALEWTMIGVRCIFYLSFWLVLFIIGILKVFFGFFESLSWWWIFAPIIFSLGLFLIFFGLYFIVEFLDCMFTFEEENKEK